MTPQEQQSKKHRYDLIVPVFLVVFGLTGVGYRIDAVMSKTGTPSNSPLEKGESIPTSILPLPKGELEGVAVPVVIEPEQEIITIPRTPLPEEVRGIYWTAFTAGTNRGQELIDYMLETGLNAVVIDLKMDNGQLGFLPNNESLKPYAMDKPVIKDLDALLKQLNEKGLYRIARIPVMRDGAFAFVHPEFAMKTASGNMWQDNIGSRWVDPAATEVADYALALAREAYTRGFDEVQFDYVRFASDGAVSHIVYPVYKQTETKSEVMRRFFKRVGGTLKEEGIPVSFDLFGMTYWSFNDFNIGQRLIDVFAYADWTSAMVYPSHYPDGFKGFANPAENPYWIVNESMEEGAKHLAGLYAGSDEELRKTFRPWLQDFDIGAVYTAHLIEEQIRATRDAGCSGWILWNARNVYEPANYRPLTE